MDVTIRYEDKDYLKVAAQDKINKYENTAKIMKTRLDCTDSEVLPIVVGSRRILPKDTKMRLKKLGFNQNNMLTISMMSLRSSLEIANAFIDYDKIV